MEVIIYDTEFTSWEGSLENKWSREGEAKEIVQFSATKLKIDHDITSFMEFDYFVKPQKNKVLSEYFSNLTGISQKQVDADGITNKKLFESLKDYSDAGNIPMFSWGNDIESIEHTAKECNELTDWVRSYDLRELFKVANYDVNHLTSGNLYKHFNLDMNIQEHNAMEDVKSLIASVEFVFQKKPQAVIDYFASIT